MQYTVINSGDIGEEKHGKIIDKKAEVLEGLLFLDIFPGFVIFISEWNEIKKNI